MTQEQVTDLILRLRELTNTSSDAELSRELGLTDRSVVSNWKRRGTVPLSECLRVAAEHGVSLDWLLLGRGEMRLPTAVAGGTPENADVVEPIAIAGGRPAEPTGLERRIASLAGVLAQLDPGHSETILSDALSRATDAQRLAVLEEAVLNLTPMRKRA